MKTQESGPGARVDRAEWRQLLRDRVGQSQSTQRALKRHNFELKGLRAASHGVETCTPV